NLPYQLGVSHTKDSFYGEVEAERMPVAEHLEMRWNAWVRGGAICSEMEAAIILILSSIHRKRAGGVMMMVRAEEGLPEDKEGKELFHGDRAIQTAIEAMKILIEQDRNSSVG
ncbi:MAG: uridine phosphorylase, partial [Chloroflexota bacterium]